METLTKRDIYSTIIRSFFIQAVWNYERMLNVGFAFCLIPVARRFSSNLSTSIVPFLKRHLGFFNANPFIATIAVGAVVKLEEVGTPPEEIERFKQALWGPLGSIGDRIFWGLVRPVSAVLGTVITLLGGGMWGGIALLVAFNTVQTIVRGVAFRHGYHAGFAVARILTGPSYRGMEVWGRRIGGLLFGFLIPTVFVVTDRTLADRTLGVYSIIILIGASATGMFFVKRGLPMNLLFPLCIAGCAIVVHLLLSSL